MIDQSTTIVLEGMLRHSQVGIWDWALECVRYKFCIKINCLSEKGGVKEIEIR